MAYRYSRFLPGFTLICDLLLLNLSLYSPLFLSLNHHNGILTLLVANVVWVIAAAILNVYKIARPLLLKDFLNRFFQTVIYHLLIVISFIYTLKQYTISSSNLFISYIVFVSLVALHRYCLSIFLDHIRKLGYNCRNILIMGDASITTRLIEHFNVHPEYGYDLIHNNLGENISSLTDEEIAHRLRENNPDEIFICYKEINQELVGRLTAFGAKYSVKIKLVSDLILTNSYARIINYDSLPILQVNSDIILTNNVKIAKRGFDIVFSSVIIFVGSPLLLSLYVITKLSSKGPAYYSQERIGLNGKPFKILKFRSMYTDAEKYGPELSKHNDPRITKWGKMIRKTRLDELPQFWNVLKGDMSIVGPRPERQHFIEKIAERKPQYKQLLAIKPGITSIGQVHYGYAENVDEMCERMQYDLLYLQNINFNSDLKLILNTVRIMVQGKGK